MKQTETCHGCVERQVKRVLEVVFSHPKAPNLSGPEREDLEKGLIRDAFAWMALQPDDLSPAELSYTPIRMACERTGLADPYTELKRRSNEEAVALLPELREWIRDSQDPLETAAHLAVAGNIIDLGIQIGYDIHESIRRVLEEGFVIDQMAAFVSDLRRREADGESPEVLYICDNAGEIAFDRLFLETLIDQFPATRFVATVNALPVLNDALMEDAEAVGLTDIVRVIDNGYGLLGTVLEKCSPEFCAAFEAADWVISKGQANYETLDGRSDKVLFLLKAKCEPIADHLGVAIYQGVFKQGDQRLVSARERFVEATCPGGR